MMRGIPELRIADGHFWMFLVVTVSNDAKDEWYLAMIEVEW